MPKSLSVLAEEVHEGMRLSSKSFATFSWAEFYKMGDIQRWREDRYEATSKAFLERGLIVGFGHQFVSVCTETKI